MSTAHLAVDIGQPHADVGELRAQADGVAILLHRLVGQADLEIRGGELGVQVGDLPLGEGVDLVATAFTLDRLAIDLLRELVLPEVIVGHGQVERGLGVVGVDIERSPEGVARRLQTPAVVVDDTHHVEDVGESVLLLEHLGEVALRLVVLALVVVLTSERDGLLELTVHRSSKGSVGPEP
jgi:hypothetical protein